MRSPLGMKLVRLSDPVFIAYESVIVWFMKKFLLASAVCVFAFPAFAQTNTITVIHEDGSEDVIELGGSAPKPAPSSGAQKSVIFKQPAETAVELSVEPAAQPAIEQVVPTIERIAEPVSKPKPAAKPKVIKKAKPQPKKKPKAVAAKKVVQDPLAVIPSRKPHRRVLQTGEVITKEKALYIALSEAPPAKDVQVYPRDGAAGLEYSVIFKTEDGGYEVVVDGASGVITSSGKVKSGQAFTKPGHLPAR